MKEKKISRFGIFKYIQFFVFFKIVFFVIEIKSQGLDYYEYYNVNFSQVFKLF